jgi:hypothetical protein
MGEVTTRLYHEGDDEEIVELLKSAFTSWALLPKPLEFWRWKYKYSPLKTHVVVSAVGDEIVGVGHCIKMRVKLGDRVLTSYYDDDYVTNPEYRKKGVYKAITNLTDKVKKDNQADFCYWITRNPIVLTKAMIHEQVTFPAPFSDLIRVKDIDQFIQKYSIKDATLFRTNYLLNKSVNHLNNLNHAPRVDFTLVDVESFDEKFEMFWDTIANDYNYFLMRNSDYMNWRFTRNPNVKYKVKAALSGDKLVGYVVLEIDNNDGYLAGSIFDLLTLPDYPDVVFPLFEETVHYFDSLDVDCISLTTMEGHSYQKIADSLGFINATYASEVHVMFWGYNNYFYEKISSLRPEKTYFSYSDYY